MITTKDFAVKSKINGKVYALYKEPGEIVTTMEPLASIGSATNFIIEMLVDEDKLVVNLGTTGRPRSIGVYVDSDDSVKKNVIMSLLCLFLAYVSRNYNGIAGIFQMLTIDQS